MVLTDPIMSSECANYSKQGLQYLTYLNGNKIYGCSKCQTHLASAEELVSRVPLPVPYLPCSVPQPPLSPPPGLSIMGLYCLLHIDNRLSEANTAKHSYSPKCTPSLSMLVTIV